LGRAEGEMTLETVVFGSIVLIFVAFTGVCLYLLWLIYGNLRVRTLFDGENDDNVAVWTFRQLIDTASQEIALHDDGDRQEGSVYDNSELIEALRCKLRNPEFQIRAHFNNEEACDLAFDSLVSEFPDQVSIVRHNVRHVGRDVHYKIADEGAMAYLSVHEFGHPDRTSKFFDCTNTPKPIRKKLFREYLDRCNAVFAAAA
ncbi:MAG: hypothetical protein OXU81_08280, partial [Gammaproteobacteria bacterium]|nr:hypothetical protein [Gammaproteobacteria bacterium]